MTLQETGCDDRKNTLGHDLRCLVSMGSILRKEQCAFLNIVPKPRLPKPHSTMEAMHHGLKKTVAHIPFRAELEKESGS